MAERKIRIEVRLSETEAKHARFVAKELNRTRADAARFLLDREYRAMKGHPDPKEAT